jgi:hypothetical protein
MEPNMVPLPRLVLAALAALGLAACSNAPAAPGPELSPPPPRVDAKTQLEYGAPPPRAPRY